jgi:hypothetical protein
MKATRMPLLAVAALLSSCATVMELDVKPVSLSQPVSASAFAPGPKLKAYGPKDYTVVGDFSFVKKIKGKQNLKTLYDLDLSEDLKAVIAAKKANAIVELKITPVDKNPGMTVGSGAAYTVSIWSGMVGLAMFIMKGINAQQDAEWMAEFGEPLHSVDPYTTPAYVFSGISLVATGLGYGLSLSQSPGMSVVVTGKAVRFK